MSSGAAVPARVPISSNVAGRLTKVAVRDNQIVLRGETLFLLDDASFRIAVDQLKHNWLRRGSRLIP
jgi:multidrug resistance efflux pump